MGSILTYHRKMAYFESSWLIFLKALIINDISLRDFISLVERDNIQVRRANSRWCESHQFNLTALRFALGLSSQAVDNAFLDRLLRSKYSAPKEVVRHCKECIKKLYHCSLFQLPWVTQCPVHKLNLIECRACSSVFQDLKLKRLRAKDRSRLCFHLWPFLEGQFPVHRLSDEECSFFYVWGESFATWFRKAREISTEDVLGIMTVPLSSNSIKNCFVYFRYLEGKIGASPLSIAAPMYDVASLSLDFMDETNKWTSQSDFEQLIACFKSLRRQIYKRCARPHHQCINQLKGLGLNNYYSLDGSVRCSCAMAYYSWLVSTLNLYTMKDINDRRINPYALDGKFHQYASGHSIQKILLESWAIFHDLWSMYELHDWGDEAQWNLEVRIRSGRDVDDYRHSLSLRTRHAATLEEKNHYYISGSFLLQQSLARCRARWGRSLVLGRFRIQDSAGLANVPRVTLFELIIPSASKKRYLYI